MSAVWTKNHYTEQLAKLDFIYANMDIDENKGSKSQKKIIQNVMGKGSNNLSSFVSK